MKQKMQSQLLVTMISDIYGYSRLTELDERRTVEKVLDYNERLIFPTIHQYNGTVVKNTGDGFLATFPSSASAVESGIDIQKKINKSEEQVSDDNKILYRIGLNIGDVILEKGDVFGNAVNISARIEGICKPGGITISRPLFDILPDDNAAEFKNIGIHKVKNINAPVRVYQWEPDYIRTTDDNKANNIQQNIEYCLSSDLVQIAYSKIGDGFPILKAPNWLNHIEYELRSPIWFPFLNKLSENYKLVRFDQRGNGLSDWEVGEISLDAMISDMESVVSSAQIDQFGVLGLSQGCAFSIRYAAKHPEQVKCLILFGGYLLGRLRRNSSEDEDRHNIGLSMIDAGWGSSSQFYRNFFTNSFIPDASKLETDSFDELQRVSTNSSNARRIQEMNSKIDVVTFAKEIRVPTLVLHCEGDQVNSIKNGRHI